jgi:hypothetical protein
MAIYKLIANGSFGPDEIEVMKAAYEAALIDVGITDPGDPITALIAKSIVNVTASGERDSKKVMERALNAAFMLLSTYPEALKTVDEETQPATRSSKRVK